MIGAITGAGMQALRALYESGRSRAVRELDECDKLELKGKDDSHVKVVVQCGYGPRHSAGWVLIQALVDLKSGKSTAHCHFGTKQPIHPEHSFDSKTDILEIFDETASRFFIEKAKMFGVKF